MNRLFRFVLKPEEEFSKTKKEKWGIPFLYFTLSILIIGLVTPLLNLVGVHSTDLSSSLQSQIVSYKIINMIYPIYGSIVMMFSPSWIVILSFGSMIIEMFLVHIIYKFVLKGKGTLLNAFKCVCYGVIPCILGGYLPFIAVFMSIYSIALKFYVFPKIAYNTKGLEPLLIFAAVLSVIFMALYVFGSTVII